MTTSGKQASVTQISTPLPRRSPRNRTPQASAQFSPKSGNKSPQSSAKTRKTIQETNLETESLAIRKMAGISEEFQSSSALVARKFPGQPQSSSEGTIEEEEVHAELVAEVDSEDEGPITRQRSTSSPQKKKLRRYATPERTRRADDSDASDLVNTPNRTPDRHAKKGEINYVEQNEINEEEEAIDMDNFGTSAWVHRLTKRIVKDFGSDKPLGLDELQDFYPDFEKEQWPEYRSNIKKARTIVNKTIRDHEEHLKKWLKNAKKNAEKRFEGRISSLENQINSKFTSKRDRKVYEDELARIKHQQNVYVQKSHKPKQAQLQSMKDNREVLATLELIGSATEMCYVPARPGRPEHFLIRYNNDANPKVDAGETEVSTRYVDQEYDARYVYSIVKHAEQHNWLAVKGRKKILFDNRPIQKIRAYRINENKLGYQGLCKGDSRSIELAENWVVSNFPTTFVQQLKNDVNDHQWVQIPPGAPSEAEIDPAMILEGAPKIRYLQGSKAYCLFYAMASALHFVGYKHVAAQLVSTAQGQGVKGDFKATVRTIVCQNLKYLQPHSYKQGQYNPFENISIYPAFLILQGEDGSINHAVATVGPWIFDANLRRALYLSRESLDWCVSTSTKKEKFKNVYYAMHFKEHPNKNKKQYRSPFGDNWEIKRINFK